MSVILKPQIFKKVLTIILAGGQGERLYPLTKDRSKPSVPFGGIYRIIDFTLSNCINSGIRRIYVLTQYKSESLNLHLKTAWNIFPRELGEFIDSIPPQLRRSNQWYQGTADAIYQNIHLMQDEKPDHVVILSGDHIYKMDYGEMLAFHLEKDADLTVAVVEIDVNKAAMQFGVLQVDDTWEIIGFQEKPKKPKPLPYDPNNALVNMGVYIWKTGSLVKAVTQDAKRQTAHDFGKNVIPALVRDTKLKIFAYNFRDENKKEVKYWRDIGTLDSYYETNMDLVQISPVFNLYDEDWPIRTYQEQYPPAKTVFTEEGRTGLALNSLISPGCIVSGGRIEKSILSPDVSIHSYSHVEDSILMNGVEIGRHAKVRRAMIDKNVIVPEGMKIGYDSNADAKKFTVTESGIVVIPKNMRLD